MGLPLLKKYFSHKSYFPNTKVIFNEKGGDMEMTKLLLENICISNFNQPTRMGGSGRAGAVL